MSKRRAEIRAEMRRITAALDARWLRAANHQLCGQVNDVIAQAGRPIRHLLLWAKFFPGEPDLSSLSDVFDPGRVVYLPIVKGGGVMEFVSITPDWRSTARRGSFDILEPDPERGAEYLPRWASETAAVIPGLAFDRAGNRLGRGGGYYDRFLSRPSMSNALVIGACWSLQLIEAVPVEDHDIGVDWVCHERGALHTGLEMADDFDEDGEDE